MCTAEHTAWKEIDHCRCDALPYDVFVLIMGEGEVLYVLHILLPTCLMHNVLYS